MRIQTEEKVAALSDKESHVEPKLIGDCPNADETKQKRKQTMKADTASIGRTLGILALLVCVSFWFGHIWALLFWGFWPFDYNDEVIGVFAVVSALVTAKLMLKGWLYLFLTFPVSVAATFLGAFVYIMLNY
ncbi:MAG: hypothetical protein AAFZ46_06720 [Pseudomonadota bacterium]